MEDIPIFTYHGEPFTIGRILRGGLANQKSNLIEGSISVNFKTDKKKPLRVIRALTEEGGKDFQIVFYNRKQIKKQPFDGSREFNPDFNGDYILALEAYDEFNSNPNIVIFKEYLFNNILDKDNKKWLGLTDPSDLYIVIFPRTVDSIPANIGDDFMSMIFTRDALEVFKQITAMSPSDALSATIEAPTVDDVTVEAQPIRRSQRHKGGKKSKKSRKSKKSKKSKKSRKSKKNYKK
jgi:hypothetical protein